MVTGAEEERLMACGYVPEHLPAYVTAITGAEPHLVGEYVCYRAGDTLTFIGYPLRSSFDERDMMAALASAVARFGVARVALAAPATSLVRDAQGERERDAYYRLDPSRVSVPGKVRNMIRRAAREVRLERGGALGEDHRRLIGEFLTHRMLGEDIRFIFERIPAYVAAVPTAQVFSARDAAGRLVAFDVAEFGAAQYAFYLFNIPSRTRYVPGTSDLLLHEILAAARDQGKAFLNLGLGINEGIARFKRKWGATPFLPYECCRYRTSPRGFLGALMQRL